MRSSGDRTSYTRFAPPSAKMWSDVLSQSWSSRACWIGSLRMMSAVEGAASFELRKLQFHRAGTTSMLPDDDPPNSGATKP